MAGSAMVFTESQGEGQSTYKDLIKKIKVAWTSDDSTGAVSGTTTSVYSGRFIGAITIPGNSPTDNYDITVTDKDGIDLALGALQNRDTANTEYVAEASMAGVVNSALTFSVSAAGNSKTGTIYLLIK